jgi:hypothetical protein
MLLNKLAFVGGPFGLLCRCHVADAHTFDHICRIACFVKVVPAVFGRDIVSHRMW